MDFNEKIFHKAQDYFADILDKISQAKSSIDVESYILQDDKIGQQFLAKLQEAGKRGVKVRIIVDGFGSREWVSHQKSFSIGANVSIRVFNPVPFFAGNLLDLNNFRFKKLFNFFSRIQKRNHKKLFIIDQEYIYTGSINIWEESLHWRELGVRISHSMADIQSYFEFTWERAYFSFKRIPHEIKRKKMRAISSKEIRCNFDMTIRKQNNKKLLEGIRDAKEKIWIMTPYFVPPLKFIKALVSAAKRGVDVRIILPGKVDLPFMKMANGFYSHYLIKNGVRVAEFKPTILHAKIMYFDKECIVGSSNFDHRSFLLNLELDILIKNSDNYNLLVKSFEKDFEQSKIVTLEDIKQQFWIKRVLSYCLLLIKSWL